MKAPIRFYTGCIVTFGLLSGYSLVSASQSVTSTSGITEYPHKIAVSSILLKWPRGSLIFPENNNPNKTDEVFLLNEAFTSESELQSLHQHLGLQLFSRSKHSEAKAEYLKALKFNPNSPDVYKNLGLMYFNTKSYKRAEKAYRKALQLDPGYTPALAKLALSLAAQKKYNLAERKFKQAIRSEPSNPDHHLNLGHFYYYLKKNYKGAKSSYQRALKLNPRLAKAKINLRDINRKFKKWKNQESNFENSWGSDIDYDNLKNKEKSRGALTYPEEADIAGTVEEENTQHPLF